MQQRWWNRYFTIGFFKMALGFLAIIGISVVIIYATGLYDAASRTGERGDVSAGE